VIWVGVNDVWHKTLLGTGTDADKFEKFYQAIIKKLKDKNIKGRVYVYIKVSEKGEIIEPRIVEGGIKDEIYNKEALRIVSMMPKQKPEMKDGKPVSVFYVLPILLNAASEQVNTTQATDQEKIFVVVEQNPQFKGGYDAMIKYIRENLHYPEAAVKAGIQGTIFVQFVISKTGKISNKEISNATKTAFGIPITVRPIDNSTKVIDMISA